MWFVQIIFWFQAFLAPVFLFGLIGLAFDSKNVLIGMIIIGTLIGIILAEYIRRKIGLDVFFARIYGPNEMDEKLKKRKNK